MPFSMHFLALFTLISLSAAWQVYNQSSHLLQPFCYPAPRLPSNFSTNPEHWTHGTPLLQNLSHSTISRLAPRQVAGYWNGWDNVHYMFSFGDSYTTTNFTISGEQPNPNNPLGNPSYPGATSANGPNYIDFLTTTYNQSYVQTYNMGYGGATVNASIVPSAFGFTVRSFSDQVGLEFLPTYVNDRNVPWAASNSLFTIFFGINDVVNSWAEENDSLNYSVIKSYESLVNELYAAGARNFLFMNVPPIDRSPGTILQGPSAQAGEAAYIGRFNFRLGALIYNLALRHPDTTSFAFDTNFLFTRVLDNPAQFEETAGYRNTTGYCAAYMAGTPTLTYFDPSCGVPVNEYFWLNTLHPTYPMHNFMASQIVQLLDA